MTDVYKRQVQRPFAAGQAVLVAVHQQREQEHQKAVRREEDGVDRQLHGDGLERQALPELCLLYTSRCV